MIETFVLLLFLGVKGARSLMEVDTLLQMFYGKN